MVPACTNAPKMECGCVWVGNRKQPHILLCIRRGLSKCFNYIQSFYCFLQSNLTPINIQNTPNVSSVLFRRSKCMSIAILSKVLHHFPICRSYQTFSLKIKFNQKCGYKCTKYAYIRILKAESYHLSYFVLTNAPLPVPAAISNFHILTVF